ncbi:MAG: hypothetical protein KDA68_05715 [Planctomycetaceae bacterium]|nr:hypothetical protein [Planctomycetaceae bacterium]
MHKLKIYRLLFVIPLLFVGCGSGDSGPDNVVKKVTKPASGKFTIDGVPPGQAGTEGTDNPPHYNILLKLYPKGRAVTKDDLFPTAKVDPTTGKYEFATYNAGDGIPAGDYIITFESLNQAPIGRYLMGPDRFKNNFNNPVSQDPKYSVKVDEASKGDVAMPNIDIKMSELTDQEPSSFATPEGAAGSRRGSGR